MVSSDTTGGDAATEPAELPGDAPDTGGFLHRVTAWVTVLGAPVGLLAAAVLIVEKLHLAADPDYVPSCSINPVLACGSVMSTPQAEAFGFPNPIIGVAGFAGLAVLGVLMAAGTPLPRFVWAGLQAGVTFAILFVHWLIYQSLYVINALCPYCMIVWAVTIPIFWYTTLCNLTGANLRGRAGRIVAHIADYHGVFLLLWYAAILAAILQRFWDYWITLI